MRRNVCDLNAIVQNTSAGDVLHGVPFCCLNYIMVLKGGEALLIRNGHDGVQDSLKRGGCIQPAEKNSKQIRR